METVSRQEILVAYLCVIGTVALVLSWSRAVRERVLERDDCGTPRGGRAAELYQQPAPAPSSRGAVYAKSAVNHSARDMWADIPNGELPLAEARAAHGTREPAFSRSAPISIGMGNASARRGAYVRGASLVQSAPSLREPSGLTPRGMGGEQCAGRTVSASSARMRANAREAPATPGASALPPSSSQWRLDNERGGGALEERCVKRDFMV
jgi:hypothetical protein